MRFRDSTLFFTLFFICAVALLATWYGSRELKNSLLRQEAISDAIRWAVFVASQSEGINAELTRGQISKQTRNALEIASRAGGVFRYKVFGPDGIILHASRPGDVGKQNTKPYFEEIVRKGRTFAKIETDENFGANRSVVSEAYVPLMENGRFGGAIEVYVNATDTAARLDQVTRYAFWGVTVLMIGVAISWAFFVGRNLKIRSRLEKELTAHRDHLQELVDTATADLKENAEELKRALEKEKELNELQRQFVSMASHEFRTPLAIIDVNAQRLKRQADKNQLKHKDAAQTGEKIRAAVRRMTQLMESTLTADRMQDGKIKVEIKPCDIGKVVREVCARQQEVAGNHIITCHQVDPLETIQGDSNSLEQVFTNLLSNAVKYAPDAPNIEVMARTEGHQVVISVRDLGIGIDADDVPRIGERFFRAKTSTGFAGTGIGLNLAKTLVEMHGGSINVESKEGEGSTFTVRLPIAGPDQSKQADTRAA